MPTLTDRDKRTIRIGAIGVVIYLVLFFGMRTWNHLEKKRSEYKDLVASAQRLKHDILPLEKRVLVTQKLKESFHMDPVKLSKASLVADASAAIQNAAKNGKVQLGPIRESPARAAAKELASIQIEGSGPVPAIIELLHRLPNLGYPIIVDAVQLNPDSKPGVLKLSLTLIILDPEKWLKEETPNV